MRDGGDGEHPSRTNGTGTEQAGRGMPRGRDRGRGDGGGARSGETGDAQDIRGGRSTMVLSGPVRLPIVLLSVCNRQSEILNILQWLIA